VLSGVQLRRPLLVIATARPEFDAEDAALAALLGVESPTEGEDKPWTVDEIPPLSGADGEALLQALLPGLILPADIAAELHEKASGLPYYYEEFARMLLRRGIVAPGPAGHYILTQELTELALPEDIQALLLGRLDMLPQELKELTMRASVLGRSFDRDLLARVHELLELEETRPLDDQLAELVAERVLVRDEGEANA
jgi:predicted ATPase